MAKSTTAKSEIRDRRKHWQSLGVTEWTLSDPGPLGTVVLDNPAWGGADTCTGVSDCGRPCAEAGAAATAIQSTAARETAVKRRIMDAGASPLRFQASTMKLALCVRVWPEIESVNVISSRYSPTGKLASGTKSMPGS